MKNRTFNRIKKMARPHIKQIILITIFAIIIDVIELARPYLVKIIIDDFLSLNIYQKGMVTIGLLGSAYIVMVIIEYILDFVVRYTTNVMGEEVVCNLRNKLYEYIQYANITFHDKTPAGKLFVRITSDAEDISSLFKEVIKTSLKDIVLIIAIVGFMIYLNAKLSLMAFIVIPFVIVTSCIITFALDKIYNYSKAIRTKLNTFLAESIYGVKLIKIFNRQYEKQTECETNTKDFLDSRKITGILEGLLPAIMQILENLGISIIVWSCINHILKIDLEVGTIYVFITYTKQLFEPINSLIENVETLQEAVVSINKIYDILEKEGYLEDLESGIIPDKIEGKIEFKNVWFAYEKEDWILKDISFTINPGESIALVGKTGSGKTTITNLINRFYDVQKGEILLDGINIKDINLKFLRKNIGIILQDPFIFARTIKENIALNSDLTDEEVLEAVRLSSAEEFVNSYPKGIHEMSKERGGSYSAGEKQLLSFARIFAHNPSIFILDEATANIDTHTELLVQKSIDVISADKTSIFIAHRLSTIVNVDKIIVLNHGKIIEVGNHQELLASGGYYSELYNAYYNSLEAV